MSRFEWVTEVIEDTKSHDLSNREIVRFHYFNPNGLWAEVKKLGDRVSELVDAGSCQPGALLVYSELGFDFFYKQMVEMNDQTRVNSRKLHVWEKMFREQLARGWEFVAEHEKGEAA